ncbi:LytR C-terminal domain-containing protein [Isoptericola croceus]|uniref:LytR C-terminal domain-containing protein n=1 Tax=Isoptericola croceus TaxID=3031406 RepID=UPI0023F96F6B|nr:LytR C-terminal domain-containing protein [Isoptericola croceus]
MTKSQYPYPPDEFDVRGPEGAPVGVHREPRSGWSSVWPFLLVAVVFAGLGVGIISFLSDSDSAPPQENPPAASEQSDAPEGSEDDDEPADGEGAEDGSGDDGDAEGSEDESEEPNDEAGDEAAEMPGDPSAANLAARVVVWNDGAGAGQAGATSEVLTGSPGFSDVGMGNATAAPVTLAGAYDATTVLYGADRADTATAVAEALGVDAANVQESDDVTNHPTDAVWVIIKEPVG